MVASMFRRKGSKGPHGEERHLHSTWIRSEGAASANHGSQFSLGDCYSAKGFCKPIRRHVDAPCHAKEGCLTWKKKRRR